MPRLVTLPDLIVWRTPTPALLIPPACGAASCRCFWLRGAVFLPPPGPASAAAPPDVGEGIALALAGRVRRQERLAGRKHSEVMLLESLPNQALMQEPRVLQQMAKGPRAWCQNENLFALKERWA